MENKIVDNNMTARAAGTDVNRKKPAGPSAAQLRKKRIAHRAWLRALLQLVFFLTMPGTFVAGFSGAKYIFQQVSTGSSLQMNSFLMTLLGLAAFTILFGRFFCGYVCAFGSFGDLLYWLSGLVQKKLLKRKKQIRIPENVSLVLQKLKYANLAVILILCGLGVYSGMSGTSPWDVFSQLTSLRMVNSKYVTGILYLVMIMVGMIFQERFFCQYLCPLGAIFSLLPVLPFSMLQRNEKNCIKGCKACQNQCPVSLKLQMGDNRSGECIACEKCVPTCPKGNISHTESILLKNEYLLVLIRAVLFFALGCYLGLCRYL